MEYKDWNKQRKMSFWLSIVFLMLGCIASVFLVFINFAVFCCALAMVFIVYFLWTFLLIGNYKLRYFFLGKDYKKQRDEVKFLQKLNKEYYPNLTEKLMKRNYWVNGCVLYFKQEITPFSLFIEKNIYFDYTNSAREEKQEHLIYLLYSNIKSGGALNMFLEEVETDGCSYDEYKSLVSDCKYFSAELKNLLLKDELKEVFECNKNFYNLTKEEYDLLEKFELGTSKLIYNYEQEVDDIIKKLAIKNYKESYRLYGLPSGYEKLFFNTDNTQRVCIWKDDSIKAYRILWQEFQFFYEDVDIINSIGEWMPIKVFGIYQNASLALKDIQPLLEDFVEYLKH